jgi:PPM family protein phosphatase
MIRLEKAHLPIHAGTHEGMSGKNNEDSFGVTSYQLNEDQKVPVLLAVLSDGIGGHRAGEVASGIAVDTISQIVSESDLSQPVDTLRSAIVLANERIYNQAQENPENKGMGATVCVALVIQNKLYTATIGDSRIYLMRQGGIRQLSIDHSWIQEALDSGLLRPDQVEGHPNAHVIRRYLGAPTKPDVDFRMVLTGKETNPEAESNQGTPLMPGDALLLTSDGLTDLVKDPEILEVVQNNSLETAVQTLITMANDRGGHDNTTIIILKMPRDYTPTGSFPSDRLRRWVLSCLGLAILAGIAGALVWGWVWYRNRLAPTLPPTPLPAVELTTAPPFAPEETQPLPTLTASPEQTETPLPSPTTTISITSSPDGSVTPGADGQSTSAGTQGSGTDGTSDSSNSAADPNSSSATATPKTPPAPPAPPEPESPEAPSIATPSGGGGGGLPLPGSFVTGGGSSPIPTLTPTARVG